MNRLLLFALIVFTGSAVLHAQDNYKVIRVNGNIILKARGVSLETGTVFSEDDDLLFSTDDATAAVINSRKGRLILTSREHDLSKTGSNYMPAMYNIASRGGLLLNLTDLRNHFTGKYVILDKQLLKLDDTSFPMDDNSYFFLRYIYKGEEINKKLEYSDDTLIIDKNKLYTVDGNPIPSPDNTIITLFYRKGNESVRVNSFELIFPDTGQLKSEISVILDELKGISDSEKVNEINSYITETYGTVSRDNLLLWLESHFGINAL